jgi:hypothetical protein
MDATCLEVSDVFRRRRAADDVADDEFDEAEYDDDLDDDADDDVDDVEAEPRPAVTEILTTGPWDVAHVPATDETPRVDLGGLLIPIPEGVELRVEVADDVVVAAALVDGNSQLMVNAFAAPKTTGIWDDVRNEIADSLRGSGGFPEHVTGAFGTELRARLPDDTGNTHPARFIGVDGPRWFLRGLVSGAAATDPAQARRLEEIFRGIVVVRGGDAMAPRDPLPLHLPREAIETMSEQPAEDGDDEAPRLQLQERGPEITEIR